MERCASQVKPVPALLNTLAPTNMEVLKCLCPREGRLAKRACALCTSMFVGGRVSASRGRFHKASSLCGIVCARALGHARTSPPCSVVIHWSHKGVSSIPTT